MTAEPVTFDLPETMKVEECHALDQFLRATPDCTIHLNGQNVQKFGGLAAQTVAAHQRFRQQDSHAIHFVSPSEALVNALTLLGLGELLNGDRTHT